MPSKRVSFPSDPTPQCGTRKTRHSLDSTPLHSPLPTKQARCRSRSVKDDLPSPKSLLDDGPNFSAADYLSTIFEFVPYTQLLRSMTVCSAWQRAAREKLQEWSVVETEGSAHAVRGLKGKSQGKLRSPSSIAVLPDRSISVVDFHNRRIQVLAPTAMEPDGGASPTAGTSPFRAADIVHTLSAGKTPFVGPTCAISDGQGHLLVADNQTHTVYRLGLKGDDEGTVLGRSGGHGRAHDQLWDPEGMALDEEGLLYVADSGNHRIVVFQTRTDSASASGGASSASASSGGASGGASGSDSGGASGSDSGGSSSSGAASTSQELTPLRSFGSMGFGDGQLSSPYGVAVAPLAAGGLVYVADTLGSRICVFTRRGSFVRAFGARASGPGKTCAPGVFHLPRSVCIVKGHLVVVEDRRLQILTLEGAVRQIVEFGSGVDGLAPTVPSSGVRVHTISKPASPNPAGGDGGAHADDEAGLWGVATDEHRMYISDSRRHRLHVFKLRRGA